MIRLSDAGARALDRWLNEGVEIEAIAGAEQAMLQRLIRGGLVHPVPAGGEDAAGSARGLPSVGFVVPVYDDAAGLDRLLAAVRVDFAAAPVVVVDDASPRQAAEAIAAVAARHAAELLRHQTNRGPGAARNTGARLLLDSLTRSASESSGLVGADAGLRPAPEVIVFLDADVVPVPGEPADRPRAEIESRWSTVSPGSIERAIAHFDPSLSIGTLPSAVAPRVRSEAGRDLIARYERDESPLDLGAQRSIVHPGGRLSYVPSAALAMRTEVFESHGGFAETMRFGEDVDLVWRIIDGGGLVRYEPDAVVEHRNRPSVIALARQRFSYGSSAAELAARHGDKVAPLKLPLPVVAATLACVFGGWRLRAAAGAIAFANAAELSDQLADKVDEPAVEAVRLSAMTHGYALQGLAAAATRTWAPMLLPFRRTRRALALALVVPALLDWVRNRRAATAGFEARALENQRRDPGRSLKAAGSPRCPLDPLRFVVMRALDHGSYCAGVWMGAVRRRSGIALLPNLRKGASS